MSIGLMFERIKSDCRYKEYENRLRVDVIEWLFDLYLIPKWFAWLTIAYYVVMSFPSDSQLVASSAAYAKMLH